jgi:succinylarginine dihydrolase
LHEMDSAALDLLYRITILIFSVARRLICLSNATSHWDANAVLACPSLDSEDFRVVPIILTIHL